MRNAFLGVLVSLFVLAGCANSGSDNSGAVAAPLAEGLTVLDAHAGALSLAYRQGEVVIYLEALRGHETPAAYREDPMLPRYEVDARFTDAQGFVFYSQQGGDGWVEPAWADALERQSSARAPTSSNEVLFRVAGEAADVMRTQIEAQIGPALADALEPEISALHSFAEQAPGEYAEQVERLSEHRNAPVPTLAGRGGDVTYGGGDIPEDASYGYGANYYYIAVHDAAISGTFGLGRHSSTALYSWAGSSWLHVHNACNHGSCGTAMPQKCMLQYFEAVNDYHPAWTLRTCNTGYDLASGSGHNCHDDSRVQMHNFVYGSAVSGSQFWCNNDDDSDISSSFWPWPSDQDGSPECNARSSKGYHHPAMCAYTWNATCPASWQGTNDGCDCGCVFPDGTGADNDCR